MNRTNCILIIVLLVIMPLSFAVAGELIIYSSEGVETLSTPDSQPSDRSPDNYRKISERCIRNCDEIAPSRNPVAKSPTKRQGERFISGITEGQLESQPQWQLSPFRSERKRGDSERYLAPTTTGATDQRGNYYPRVGPNTYLELETGNIVIGPSFGR